MNTELQDRLGRTRPAHLPAPDLEVLHQRGRRRRRVRQAVAGTGSIAAVALVGVVLTTVATPNVKVVDPAASAAASPADAPASRDTPSPTTPPADASAWDDADLETAIERLAELAAQHPGLPPLADGESVEVLVRGIAGRGNVDRQWLQAVASIVDTDQDGPTSYRVHEDPRELDIRTSFDELRRAVAEIDPSTDTFEEADEHDLGDQVALSESEDLAAAPAREPSDEATERPDRAYALVRLADALRTSVIRPGEPDVHRRAFAVLDAVGTDWLTYRGTVTDLLGREVVGIGTLDPNGGETILLFDPNTGWYVGELDVPHPDGVAELRHDGARRALPDDAWISGGARMTFDTVDTPT